MGFYVKRVTPLTIIVEAPRETFEGVFRGKLGHEPSTSMASGWRWKGAVRIPEELRERVDTVLFPEPTRLHF
ncbi:MAG TPA: hypothetical protein VJT67_09325 [Longimicrobiaceae bacterium]|nr:hypothetical protein [Longimicrobiaceae bacterium]